MSDHPLYLRRITLPDGRLGTVIDVYQDGSLCVEPEGATGIDDLVTITEELGPCADHLAELKAMIAVAESKPTLDLAGVSDAEFAAYLTMTSEELKTVYGDFGSITITGLTEERMRALLWASNAR